MGRKGVVIRYAGSVSSSELSVASARIQGSEKFDGLLYAIHDLTDCESLTCESMELTTMVVRASVAVEKHKVIAVAFVGSIPALNEAFRHFKSVGVYERDLQIFTSLTQARDFIAKVTGPKPRVA